MPDLVTLSLKLATLEELTYTSRRQVQDVGGLHGGVIVAATDASKKRRARSVAGLFVGQHLAAQLLLLPAIAGLRTLPTVVILILRSLRICYSPMWPLRV